MLVCNVSLRPRGRVIAADIAEAAAALDATMTGLVVFATLVDDPANVRDIVDAYLGEIMLEAASASDSVSSGFAYDGSIQEVLTANTAQDATTTTPPTTTTWNPSDKSSITLTGGDLTATATSQGAVRSISGKTAGKYYFEITVSTWASASTTLGMALSSYSPLGIPVGSANSVGFGRGGSISINGSSAPGLPTLGSRTSGDIIGIAIDKSAQLIWFRVAPSGNWNGSGTANPATGTGGIDTSALSGALYACFAGFQVNEVATANFGASAFSGTVPSGFTAGF